jgi:hypothetical protein
VHESKSSSTLTASGTDGDEMEESFFRDYRGYHKHDYGRGCPPAVFCIIVF